MVREAEAIHEPREVVSSSSGVFVSFRSFVVFVCFLGWRKEMKLLKGEGGGGLWFCSIIIIFFVFALCFFLSVTLKMQP